MAQNDRVYSVKQRKYIDFNKDEMYSNFNAYSVVGQVLADRAREKLLQEEAAAKEAKEEEARRREEKRRAEEARRAAIPRVFTPYEILGLRPNALESEIRIAYKTLAKKYHPDRFSDPVQRAKAEENMKIINTARDRALSEILG